MIKLLYIEPLKDINDIMNCTMTYMLANKALHSYNVEARDLSLKESKISKKSEPSN